MAELDALVAGIGPNLPHARQGFEHVLDALFATFTDQSME